jgi:glycosyltransferase involved in cell wall biosynthesis
VSKSAVSEHSEDLPALCILIPVYKDQAGLERTLEVLAPEAYPFDIVLVDDGSPEPIVAPETCGTHGVTLRRMPQNSGVPAALNAGLEVILEKEYRYVARLDCGDLPLLGRLGRQVEFLEQHPDVGIVGTWVRCVDERDEPLFMLRFPVEDADIKRRQRYVPSMLASAIIIRMDAMQDTGPYFSTDHKYAEDFEIFVRIGQKWRLYNIPEPLTEYIISTSGLTAQTGRKNLWARLRVQTDYFNWRDPHASLGVVRTLIWMLIPFTWGLAVKKRLWKS